MHISEEQLNSILLKSGLISNEDFNFATAESKQSGQPVSNILISNRKIAEEYVTELLGPYYGTPVINLKKKAIDRATLELIPEIFAKGKSVVIFHYDKEKKIAKVAMLDPFDYDTIEYLRAKLNAWVEVYLTTRSGLGYGLKQYKQQVKVGFEQTISENIEQSLALVQEKDISKTATAVPIVTILDNIIEQAITLNSS